MRSPLRIAGCQFSVEADIEQNQSQILAQIREAADSGARVVHFPEAALSGYAGVDVPDFKQVNWDALQRAMKAICQAAAKSKVWVLLGSAHRLSGDHLPHNCIYVISHQGKIVDRYDKRFCTGNCGPDAELDLKYYTPGNHSTVFEIDGYKCATLICYDYRFPELYRDLKRQGVEVLFQSFHNARKDYRTYHQGNIWKEIVPATMMCHAATNYFWISAANSATKYSLWGNFFVRPDGHLVAKLPLHQTAVLIGDVEPEPNVWDASQRWRGRAMEGQLHSGELVDDPRSTDRTCI